MTAPAWAFDLRGVGSETVELDIFDNIGEGLFSRGVTAKDVSLKMKEAGGSAKDIKVRINSRGGDIIEGLTIHNLLAEHDANVDVQVVGLAASMASVIAMAGDTISMSSGAFLMVHNPWGIAVGESDDLRQHADLLDKMRDTLVSIYAARSKQTPAAVRKWMDAETWMKAEEAKANGFADKVVKPSKSAKKTAAQAFAMLEPEQYENLPEELRALAAPRTTANPRPGRTEPDDPDEETMTLPVAILLALGLNESATETNAVASLNALKTERDDAKAKLSKLEAATGKTGDEAHGAILAFKDSHGKLPAVQTELATLKGASENGELVALLKKGRDDKKLTKAQSDKLEAQVRSYWAARAESKEPPDDAMSLGAAKAFVATMTPNAVLAATPAGSTPDVTQTEDGPMKHNGKAFEEMAPKEHLALAKATPELYDALRADAVKRGAI